MKRILLAVLLSISLALPARADVGSALIVLNAVVADGDSSTYNVSKVSSVRVQVYSAAGSTGIVTIYLRSTSTAPWFPVVTITDPSSTGEYWAIPLAMQFKATVSGWSSGAITVILETHQIGSN